ncbi:MAG: glycosyltransferase family A protein [Elusimicrobiales bacterium]|nr:glycosyltransferase family A protein [Elusimicrobiales bacterium]
MTQQKAPLVSVIMPSYNHARYIGRAVESVLEQTAGDLELIVVDNQSADGTDEVLAAIKDPRLRVLKIANGGIIAASRNLGLKNAAGEYAAFVDSDDIWQPEKLERQLEALRAAPGAVLAYSRFKTLTGDTASEAIYPRPSGCVSGRVFGRLYLKHFIACSGVLARRSALLAAGGFSEERELVAIEDSDLWLRLAQTGEVVCSSDRALFLYRVHPGAASAGSWRRFRRELLLARRHYLAAGPARFVAAACLSFAAAVRAELAARLPGRSE